MVIRKHFHATSGLTMNASTVKCEVTNIARKLKENPNNPVIANVSGIKEKI